MRLFPPSDLMAILTETADTAAWKEPTPPSSRLRWLFLCVSVFLLALLLVSGVLVVRFLSEMRIQISDTAAWKEPTPPSSRLRWLFLCVSVFLLALLLVSGVLVVRFLSEMRIQEVAGNGRLGGPLRRPNRRWRCCLCPASWLSAFSRKCAFRKWRLRARWRSVRARYPDSGSPYRATTRPCSSSSRRLPPTGTPRLAAAWIDRKS